MAMEISMSNKPKDRKGDYIIVYEWEHERESFLAQLITNPKQNPKKFNGDWFAKIVSPGRFANEASNFFETIVFWNNNKWYKASALYRVDYRHIKKPKNWNPPKLLKTIRK